VISSPSSCSFSTTSSVDVISSAPAASSGCRRSNSASKTEYSSSDSRRPEPAAEPTPSRPSRRSPTGKRTHPPGQRTTPGTGQPSPLPANCGPRTAGPRPDVRRARDALGRELSRRLLDCRCAHNHRPRLTSPGHGPGKLLRLRPHADQLTAQLRDLLGVAATASHRIVSGHAPYNASARAPGTPRALHHRQERRPSASQPNAALCPSGHALCPVPSLDMSPPVVTSSRPRVRCCTG